MKKKKNFNIIKYNFAECIKDIFKVEDLAYVHDYYKSDYELFPAPQVGKLANGKIKGTDQGTVYHEKYYQEIAGTDFFNIYKEFVANEIYPLFLEDILFQKIPTFRVQLPNNLAVGGWHKDRNYNHSSDEVNIFLPLTEAKDSNTIWAESEEGKADYKPMNAEYGEYHVWEGANLNHGNKQNKEGKCRVSIDFRILPFSKYDESAIKESYGIGAKFKLGEYWEFLKI